jgi:hypothetical protein
LANQYSVYPGKFPCKTCGEVVSSLRYWQESGDATWQCTKKHISKVGLKPVKRSKKDFEV